MLFLYDLGIKIYYLLIRIAAFTNTKAKHFIDGRKNIFQRIANSVDPGEKSAWFHFASLGEFEQGRPVLEQFRSKNPEQKIIITFFSPSGYEIRKNTPLADAVFYLPMDTKKNAKRFIDLINPKFAVFTKYEYWYYYYEELHFRNLPLYVISAIFRPNQPFFKWYGNLNRKILSFVTHFFVQDQKSITLLNSIGLTNATLSGDTRFDRVAELAKNPEYIETVRKFTQNQNVFIAGSTWLEDEKLISQLAEQHQNCKFIIAPHEIGENRIAEVELLFPDAVKYSEIQSGRPKTIGHQTLIVDNIGLLSSLYAYGNIAYIGGGFGKGIHNTLEAAAYGLPTIFGPNYKNFKEARDLVKIGAAKSISDVTGLKAAFEQFSADIEAGEKAKKFVVSSTGATELIISSIQPS